MKKTTYSLVIITSLILFFCAIKTLPLKADELNLAHGRIWGCGEETFREIRLNDPPLSGEDVYELEKRLKELGFSPGVLDGVFDQDTEEAVKNLQIANDLPATGVVDKDTWEVLGQDCEPTNNPQTPAPEGQIKIVIEKDKRLLTVYADGKPYKQYPVAIGKSSTPSPVGEWKVINKSKEWGSGFGTRWIGLNVPWGIYGIHGTNKPWSIGQAASHGCFRMYNKHVEEIFPWVKVGTPVIVTGDTYTSYNRILKNGSIGQDVVLIQQKLRAEKLLWLPADGRFGAATERALKLYQMFNGLQATGQVDKALWDKMLNKD
ncbi:MAG: L,D-transpeptidase family protein [Zhaonellaceae bacterium]|jgi:peptidoglycan hydrolase-like protein with peptidoglycan-binding domain|nr:L,D-transpeptidase family protein [Clostridia bacterium]